MPSESVQPAFGQGEELVIVRSRDEMKTYPAERSVPEMNATLHELPVPPTIEQRDVSELDERARL